MKHSFLTSLRPLTLLALLFTGLLSTACKKDEATVSPADDDKIIQQYIADKAIRGAQRQASGLYYVPLVTNPTAIKAQPGNTVEVLYTGTFLDGRVFDATSQRGNVPLGFVLGRGRVIQGWDEGIALMRKGEKSLLLIPSALAYGSQGQGPIGPNTVLRFEVELVDVK